MSSPPVLTAPPPSTPPWPAPTRPAPCAGPSSLRAHGGPIRRRAGADGRGDRRACGPRRLGRGLPGAGLPARLRGHGLRRLCLRGLLALVQHRQLRLRLQRRRPRRPVRVRLRRGPPPRLLVPRRRGLREHRRHHPEPLRLPQCARVVGVDRRRRLGAHHGPGLPVDRVVVDRDLRLRGDRRRPRGRGRGGRRDQRGSAPPPPGGGPVRAPRGDGGCSSLAWSTPSERSRLRGGRHPRRGVAPLHPDDPRRRWGCPSWPRPRSTWWSPGSSTTPTRPRRPGRRPRAAGHLARGYIGATMGDVINAAGIVSAFGAQLACVNAGSRLLFSLGRELGGGRGATNFLVRTGAASPAPSAPSPWSEARAWPRCWPSPPRPARCGRSR